MMLGTSVAALGLSAGGIVLFGHQVTATLFDAMALTAAVSAFVAICSAEASSAS